MRSVNSEIIINEFCKSMRRHALVNFMHDITFGKGQVAMLAGSDELVRYYQKNQIPMLCTDDSGRTLPDGIYINRILEKNYRDCKVLMPLMVRIGRQFDQNYGKNSVHIVKQEEGCQHLYSLFFDLEENDFYHWIINNGKLLNDAIFNYTTYANDIINEASEIENRISLPNYNVPVNDYVSNSNILRLIHRKLNIPVRLPSQQSICLRLLMHGKSAKEIGLEMKLSHRTVEHYFMRIRDVLGCSTNKELVIYYYEQIV